MAELFYRTNLRKERVQETLALILENVVKATGVSADDILSSSKFRNVVRVRHIFCDIAWRHYTIGVIPIGRFINRDHSTVTNAVQVIQNDCSHYEEVKLLYDYVLAVVNLAVSDKLYEPQP